MEHFSSHRGMRVMRQLRTYMNFNGHWGTKLRWSHSSLFVVLVKPQLDWRYRVAAALVGILETLHCLVNNDFFFGNQ
jgi:hypothetical protein